MVVRHTQTVYSVNVAGAISRVVDNPENYEVRTVDCFGAEDYACKELAEFVLRFIPSRI